MSTPCFEALTPIFPDILSSLPKVTLVSPNLYVCVCPFEMLPLIPVLNFPFKNPP
jgi:hypothetical protein